jgi:hypothetical protein
MHTHQWVLLAPQSFDTVEVAQVATDDVWAAAP